MSGEAIGTELGIVFRVGVRSLQNENAIHERKFKQAMQIREDAP